MCKLSVTPNCASPSDKQNFYFYFDFCFSFNATEKLCDILGLSIHFIILKSVLLGESAPPLSVSQYDSQIISTKVFKIGGTSLAGS